MRGRFSRTTGDIERGDRSFRGLPPSLCHQGYVYDQRLRRESIALAALAERDSSTRHSTP